MVFINSFLEDVVLDVLKKQQTNSVPVTALVEPDCLASGAGVGEAEEEGVDTDPPSSWMHRSTTLVYHHFVFFCITPFFFLNRRVCPSPGQLQH